MSWKMKAILESPLACKIMAWSMSGICFAAVIFNIYHASGGECHSLGELLSCFTRNEIELLIIGIAFLVFFMWASGVAKKVQMEKKGQKQGRNSAATAVDDECTAEYEEDVVLERQKCTWNYFGEQLTFYIPENCSPVEPDSREEVEKNRMVSLSCTTAEGDSIYVYMYPAENESAGGACADIEDSFSELSTKVQKNAKIEQKWIDGKLCHYFHVCYREKGSKWQQIYMACDVGKNNIFGVELDSVDNKRELSVTDIQDIFQFEFM